MPNNYIDGYYDYKKEQVIVWEKSEDNRILIKRYEAPYYFYIEDSHGEYLGMDGKKLKKLVFKNRKDFESARKQYRKKYESDINPLEKVLMNNYYGIPVPSLNTVFIDIENDYKTIVYEANLKIETRIKNSQEITIKTVGDLRTKLDLDNVEVYDTRSKKWVLGAISDYLYEGETGYSNTLNPYAPINAVTTYNTATQKYVTVAIANREWQYHGWGIDKIKENDVCGLLKICDLTIVNNERDLLLHVINEVKKGDVISGWNSDFFDYPYIIQRISEVLGDAYLTTMYYDFAPKPVLKETRNRYGEDALVVNASGKIHLDYMQVFKKFVAGGRSSWALAAIAAEELEDLDKLTYDGDLEGLYNNDFMYFIRYNIRDVEIMVGLEKKFKFSRLANELAHNNTALVEKVLGTVTMVDCGIINYAHYERNVIVNDKKEVPKIKIEGGLVLVPKVGLHEWIGSVDLNALYPTMKRTLNNSPEKLVGQFKEFEDAWYAIQENSFKKLTFVFEKDNKEVTKTAVEWKQYFLDNKMSISAYGTAFDQANGVGIIPGLLELWQIKRKENQALEKKYEKLLAIAIEQNNKDDISKYQDLFETHYIAQQGYKLSSNSLYGAVINEHDKFYDYRLGGSTTASGRRVTDFMMSKVCEALTGNLINTVKTSVYNEDEDKDEISYTHIDDSLIYGDTDSVAGDSVITINHQQISIEDAFCFLKGETVVRKNNTQTKYLNYKECVTPCYIDGNIEHKTIESIYRHKVNKQKYKIITNNNREVVITSDHSIMVKRNNTLIEVKPIDILESDIITTTSTTRDSFTTIMTPHETGIKEVVDLGYFEDEYVYDITMKDSNYPHFFANDILVHNSCYFKTNTDNIEDAVDVADNVAEYVNMSFKQFAIDGFLCNHGFDNLIKCGREVVANRGVFIAKKKYILHVVDKEGTRIPYMSKKSIKAMGSEIKKSDTPKVIQKFLRHISMELLNGAQYKDLETYINNFRNDFKNEIDILDLGVSKSCNKLATYTEEYKKYEEPGIKKVRLPGHVRAAINYDTCKNLFKDDVSKPITSGNKIKYFYLKKNMYGFTSIAFPADITHLPQWFLDNFVIDIDKIENKLIDLKVKNLFDALKWPTPTLQGSFCDEIFNY